MFQFSFIRRRFTKLLIALLFSGAYATYALAQSDEAVVKAALIYNFAKFVEWPEIRVIDIDRELDTPSSSTVQSDNGANSSGPSSENSDKGAEADSEAGPLIQADPLPYFNICVDADPGVVATIQSLGSKTVMERQIKVVGRADVIDLGACDIFYFEQADVLNFEDVLVEISDLPILTIGDGETFARDGGMISLIRDDNRIVFEINLNAAREAGLSLSSKLLTLARKVYDDPEE